VTTRRIAVPFNPNDPPALLPAPTYLLTINFTFPIRINGQASERRLHLGHILASPISVIVHHGPNCSTPALRDMREPSQFVPKITICNRHSRQFRF
jgi:hypothetical protein